MGRIGGKEWCPERRHVRRPRVVWVTDKGIEKNYDIFALQKTLGAYVGSTQDKKLGGK
jgi:hypothetical protein